MMSWKYMAGADYSFSGRAHPCLQARVICRCGGTTGAGETAPPKKGAEPSCIYGKVILCILDLAEKYRVDLEQFL